MPAIALGVNAPHAVAFETAVGKTVQWCRCYSQTQAWNAGSTGWADTIAADARGQNAILSFKSSFTWAQVASGSDDARLTAIANGIIANTDLPGIIVFNHEPENDGGIAADFKAASAHVRAVMRPLMPGWRFGPCLILDTFRTGSGRHPDDWVHTSNDVLLVDGYNWRDADTFGGGWADPSVADRTPASIFGTNINAADYAAALGMDFGFGEIGCSREQADTTGTERTAWWNLYADYVLGLPSGTVEMICHFEKNTSAVTPGDGGVVNWAIRSEPASAAAFGRILGNVVNVTLTPGVDTDQTASAQAQINAAPDGTADDPTIINMPAGRYRINGGLSLQNRSHIRWTCLAGVQTWPTAPADTAVFTAYTDTNISGRHHFQLDGCTDVIGSFLRIDGPNIYRDTGGQPLFAEWFASRENQHAFSVYAGCVESAWQDCSYNNVYGDGMYVGFQNSGVANVDCWVYRHTGLYSGRHVMSLTHCVGFNGIDIRGDFSGFAGVDIEPNSDNDKTWDIYLENVAAGSKFYPFTFQGAVGSGGKKNIHIKGCSAIRCPSNHTAIITRNPSTGGLIVENHTDTRQPTIYGLDIAGWDDITVKNSTIRVKANAATTYAVRSGNTGTVTLTGNTFTGTVEGFDQLALFTVTPSNFVHFGNVWAFGTQNDGTVGGQSAFAASAPTFAGAGTASNNATGHIEAVMAVIAGVGAASFVDPDVNPPLGSVGGAPYRLRQRKGRARPRGAVGARMRGQSGPTERHVTRLRPNLGGGYIRSDRFSAFLRSGAQGVPVTGTGAFAAVKPAFAGIGAHAEVIGTGALTAANAVLAGTAVESIPATGAFTASAAALAGAGAETNTAFGQFAAVKAAFAGTGTQSSIGAGAFAAAASAFAGTGLQTITGVGAFAPVAPVLAGTAEETISGTGTFAAAPAFFESSAEEIIAQGTGDFAATSAAFAGAGIAPPEGEGVGAITAADAALAGAGVVSAVGAGNFGAAAAVLAGTSSQGQTATGALAGGAAALAGIGVLTIEGTAETFGGFAALAGRGQIGSNIWASPPSFQGYGAGASMVDEIECSGPQSKWKAKQHDSRWRVSLKIGGR